MNKNMFLLLTMLSAATVVNAEESKKDAPKLTKEQRDEQRKKQLAHAKTLREQATNRKEEAEKTKKLELEDASMAALKKDIADAETNAKKADEATRADALKKVEDLKKNLTTNEKAINDKYEAAIKEVNQYNKDAYELEKAAAVGTWSQFFSNCGYNTFGLPLRFFRWCGWLQDEPATFKHVAAVTTAWAVLGGASYFAYTKYQEQQRKQKEDQSIDDIMQQLNEEMRSAQTDEAA